MGILSSHRDWLLGSLGNLWYLMLLIACTLATYDHLTSNIYIYSKNNKVPWTWSTAFDWRKLSTMIVLILWKGFKLFLLSSAISFWMWKTKTYLSNLVSWYWVLSITGAFANIISLINKYTWWHLKHPYSLKLTADFACTGNKTLLSLSCAAWRRSDCTLVFHFFSSIDPNYWGMLPCLILSYI